MFDKFFKKSKRKETEIDITSLNDIIRTSRKLIRIGFFMAIVCLILLGTYLIQEWKILKYLGELISVISPIFIGFLLAWLCIPAVKFLESKGLPKLVACILVYVGILAFIILLLTALVPSFVQQMADFATSLPSILEEIKDFSDDIFRWFNRSIIDSMDLKDNIYKAIEGFGTELTTDLPQKLFVIGKSVVSGGINLVLGLMIGFYVLYDFDKLNNGLKGLLPVNWREGYDDLCNRLNNSLRGYVQGLLVVMLLVFLTQSIGLTLAGLKAPLLFALFCAITDVIPYFGPYIGAIPAVIVGFTMSPIVGICCIISIVVVQLLENNFYQPLIMGHTMQLHPVTIMIGLLVFEHFFGILGMIVATPAIACIKVIIMFINEKTGIGSKVTGEEESA